MQLLGLLAHVDDVVLAKHLWRVGLVSTRAAQGLAWNIHPLDAVAFQKDPDKTLFTSEEDWQKGKWLKVCDSAVHSIFILPLVAKSMPVSLIARKWWQFLFPFLAMLHGEWRCKTISNFCLWITKKQSKFEGVVKPWKTVLSIHFSNLFPQPAQMTWINGKKIGMFWLLWKSENLLQQQHYICRGKNHLNSCPICPKIWQIACMHGLVVLKSVTKKKPRNRFWLAVGCKQMDQEEQKWAQSWIYERIRPKWCCHGKLFPLEKQSIIRV